jgi:hypothetical protein
VISCCAFIQSSPHHKMVKVSRPLNQVKLLGGRIRARSRDVWPPARGQPGQPDERISAQSVIAINTALEGLAAADFHTTWRL